jgi:hypothetical protein
MEIITEPTIWELILALFLFCAFWAGVTWFAIAIAKIMVEDMDDDQLESCTDFSTEEDNVLFGGRL